MAKKKKNESMAGTEDDLETSRDLVNTLHELAERLEVGSCSDNAIHQIEDVIDAVGVFSALSDSIDINGRVTRNLEEVLHQLSAASQQQQGGGAGNVVFDIPIEALEQQVFCGLPSSEIAIMFGVSRRTITRRMAEYGLRKRNLYSAVDDAELDRMVCEIHRNHPNTGLKLMCGHLNARGVRVPGSRVRESLRRVDAEGVHMRRLRLRVSRRRQYSVAGPNSLWHIDGNHKLIRWRFIIHGGVDGFSRLVVYLTVAGNNRAITVLQSFLTAVDQYGLPSRVRSDKGGENADVAEFMIRSRGADRNSHITGRSVHNQRIERLWRDVYEHTLDLFYQIFTSLEDQGLLNPDTEVHLFALHRSFLPVIQHSLNDFRDAWNCHGLRTERNQSPQQLWIRHREQGPMEDPLQVPDDYGIDWNGPHSLDGGMVSVPEVQLARELSEEERAILPPVGVSVAEAIRAYEDTVEAVSRMMLN